MTIETKPLSHGQSSLHEMRATLDQQVLTVERLLAADSTEVPDREATYKLMDEAIQGRRDALLEMPLHSCALLKYSAHDVDKLAALDSSPEESPEILSRLASLYLQVKQYRKSGKIFNRIAMRRPLTPLENFLAYKAAFMEGDYKFLRDFKPELVRDLAEKFPNIAYELLARHQLLEDSATYRQEALMYTGLSDSGKLDDWSRRFRALKFTGQQFDESGFKHDQDYLSNILAVYGMRCSGGSAVQDFLFDSSEVKSSAGEYLLMSGIYGLRYLHKHSYSGLVFHEMLRHHLFGNAVPVNRGFSRVLRQAREDRQAGLLEEHMKVVDQAFEFSQHKSELVLKIIDGVWENYVLRYRKKLLLKKLFSSGNFEHLYRLPPFTGIMVWRDPRDQYVDQCKRGFVRRGDVATFVKDFRSKVHRLKEGLSTASDMHREKLLNVGFEEFVQSQNCRNDLLRRIGINAASVRGQRFDPKVSSRNIGIWKNNLSSDEMSQLENGLHEYMDSSSISLETIIRK